MKWMLAILFCASISGAQNPPPITEEPPLFEYGLGVGGVHFQQYPASNQSSDLFLPFPTFQYRGKVLRADDREGTHAYLLKTSIWSVEISGGVNPPLKSSENEARKGMSDIPWMIKIGPQVVARFASDWEARVSVFPATSTDFQYTKFSGGSLEGRLLYRFGTSGRVSLSVEAGTKDFLATYFAVPGEFATAKRPQYDAREGFLEDELSYFQSFKFGRLALYAGLALSDFGSSVNRVSLLHKSDVNFQALTGVTYVLGESRRPSVPEEKAGVINRPTLRRLRP